MVNPNRVCGLGSRHQGWQTAHPAELAFCNRLLAKPLNHEPKPREAAQRPRSPDGFMRIPRPRSRRDNGAVWAQAPDSSERFSQLTPSIVFIIAFVTCVVGLKLVGEPR